MDPPKSNDDEVAQRELPSRTEVITSTTEEQDQAHEGVPRAAVALTPKEILELTDREEDDQEDFLAVGTLTATDNAAATDAINANATTNESSRAGVELTEKELLDLTEGEDDAGEAFMISEPLNCGTLTTMNDATAAATPNSSVTTNTLILGNDKKLSRMVTTEVNAIEAGAFDDAQQGKRLLPAALTALPPIDKEPPHLTTQEGLAGDDGAPPPPSLRRLRASAVPRPPGAVAVAPSGESSIRWNTNNRPDEEAGTTATTAATIQGSVPHLGDEPLLNATLVNDHEDHEDQHLVNAEPAPEGLQAMVQNRHFKLVTCLVVAAIALAVAIPLVVTLPSSSKGDQQQEEGSSILTCGSRFLYQGDYRGNVAVTENGFSCQRWDVNFPNVVEYTEAERAVNDLTENFCRNACGECEPRAWCYTTNDPEDEWGYCDIPYCEEDVPELSDECGHIAVYQQENYRGSINITNTGKTCQRWDSQYPHSHSSEKRINTGIEENFCRNPDGSRMSWCYTTDPTTRWEYCDIPHCEVLNRAIHSTTPQAPCENCTSEECGDLRVGMRDYRGKKNTTINGYACERWDSNDYMHRLDISAGIGLSENYCRNPETDGRSGWATWCFTTDPERSYDICDVPRCEDNFEPRRQCGSQLQEAYRGDLAVTMTGKSCDRWDSSDAAARDGNTPFAKPWDGLISNHCRNPVALATRTKRSRAWCYVVDPDPEIEWEYCDVELCQDCGSSSLAMIDYTGAQSVAMSGKTCLNWETREHLFINNTTFVEQYRLARNTENTTDWYKIREDLQLEANFCRNPFGQQNTPWCFTGEDETEPCDVPICEDSGFEAFCGSSSVRQADYRGDLNRTASGDACVPWDIQSEYPPDLYPEAGLDGASCRQPAGVSKLAAWCFISATSNTWGYCDVPLCEDI